MWRFGRPPPFVHAPTSRMGYSTGYAVGQSVGTGADFAVVDAPSVGDADTDATPLNVAAQAGVVHSCSGVFLQAGDILRWGQGAAAAIP